MINQNNIKQNNIHGGEGDLGGSFDFGINPGNINN